MLNPRDVGHQIEKRMHKPAPCGASIVAIISVGMKPATFKLADPQIEKLKRLKKEKCVNASAFVRRAIDECELDSPRKPKQKQGDDK